MERIIIFSVKLFQNFLEYNYSYSIFGYGHKKPYQPFDTWSSIGFLVSMLLGYLFPFHLPFMLTTIFLLDIYNFLIKKRNVSKEHIIMGSVTSALGFIVGIYFRIGILI